MALATHPNRTILVVLGNLQLPSDLAGLHHIHFSHTDPASLIDPANRPHAAGCDTGIRWLDPARFPDRTITISPPRDPLPAVPHDTGGTKLPGHIDGEAQALTADQRARQDVDGGQVEVTIETVASADRARQGPTHLITVTTPSTYPIKQVEAAIAWQPSNGVLTVDNDYYVSDPPAPLTATSTTHSRSGSSPG